MSETKQVEKLVREPADLQRELARRRRFPAHSDRLGYTVPQAVTVADLERELAALPADDAGRDWKEWELALAREHYRLTKDVPFLRQVVKEMEVAL